MASKVTAQVAGGSPKVFDGVETVGEIAEQLNVSSYTATVNGEPADHDQELEDHQYVSFAKPVKAG